jgi:hypothetical protein
MTRKNEHTPIKKKLNEEPKQRNAEREVCWGGGGALEMRRSSSFIKGSLVLFFHGLEEHEWRLTLWTSELLCIV